MCGCALISRLVALCDFRISCFVWPVARTHYTQSPYIEWQLGCFSCTTIVTLVVIPPYLSWTTIVLYYYCLVRLLSCTTIVLNYYCLALLLASTPIVLHYYCLVLLLSCTTIVLYFYCLSLLLSCTTIVLYYYYYLGSSASNRSSISSIWLFSALVLSVMFKGLKNEESNTCDEDYSSKLRFRNRLLEGNLW